MIDWHKTVDFVKRDWHGHPVRLCLEVFNWFLNIIVVVTFAVTVPDVPFLVFYPVNKDERDSVFIDRIKKPELFALIQAFE